MQALRHIEASRVTSDYMPATAEENYFQQLLVEQVIPSVFLLIACPLLPSVNTIALGTLCGAKYTHHTITPTIKKKQ